ncbi:hypothetical protein AMK18_19780 [Streptomyces sp. CB01249]|nr:hypothetical protein AMK18_19780 [Streptomyces sp. CB01249]
MPRRPCDRPRGSADLKEQTDMPQATAQARPLGHPGYSQTMPRKPESAAAARRFTDTALSCWGLEELADDCALIVSELVANSVRYARRDFIVIPEAAPEAPGEAAEDE